MDNLITFIIGNSSSFQETIVRIIVFLIIVEFIGGLFALIGKMKGN